MIRQRPNGTWQGRLPNGKDPETGKRRNQYVSANSMKEVKALMKHIKDNPSEISTPAGKYVKLDEIIRSGEEILLGDWLDIWMKKYKSNDLKLTTYERYRMIIENHIKPTLGDIPLSELTTDLIQGLLNEKQKVGARLDEKEGKLNPATIKKIKTILKGALNQAVKDPTISISSNPAVATTTPAVSHKVINILTPEDQDRFIEVLQGTRFASLFILALGTGMRKGELLALKWDDVDFEKRTITISKTLTLVRNQTTLENYLHVGEPKTEAGNRVIPVFPFVISSLKAHFDKQQMEKEKAGTNYNDCGFVFCTYTGNHLQPRNVIRSFVQLIDQSGIRRIPFHGLRHTFATRALEAGIPAKVVQTMLGHKDVKTTLNIYTHLLNETLYIEMQRMDEVFTLGAVKVAAERRVKRAPELER
jgi:integrase